MRLSLIIPAYNEANRDITTTLDEYYNTLKKKYGKDFELGIIPNNCSDNTERIVSNWIKSRPQAWIHVIKGYSGKGGAVMRGFDIAKGDWIGFVDADNSTTINEFLKCINSIGKRDDGAIASRRFPSARIIPKRAWYKNLSSWLFNFVANTLFFLKSGTYYDTQCGCKVFNKDCAKFLVDNCQEKGWAFDVEVLYLCEKNGFSIKECPIKWTDKEGSKLSFYDGIKSVFSLFKLRWRKL
jgi:glycosyltransferase involved in cell wall biosynthesis